jgi:hypothetical protein
MSWFTPPCCAGAGSVSSFGDGKTLFRIGGPRTAYPDDAGGLRSVIRGAGDQRLQNPAPVARLFPNPWVDPA